MTAERQGPSEQGGAVDERVGAAGAAGHYDVSSSGVLGRWNASIPHPGARHGWISSRMRCFSGNTASPGVEQGVVQAQAAMKTSHPPGAQTNQSYHDANKTNPVVVQILTAEGRRLDQRRRRGQGPLTQGLLP